MVKPWATQIGENTPSKGASEAPGAGASDIFEPEAPFHLSSDLIILAARKTVLVLLTSVAAMASGWDTMLSKKDMPQLLQLDTQQSPGLPLPVREQRLLSPEEIDAMAAKIMCFEYSECFEKMILELVNATPAALLKNYDPKNNFVLANYPDLRKEVMRRMGEKNKVIYPGETISSEYRKTEEKTELTITAKDSRGETVGSVSYLMKDSW